MSGRVLAVDPGEKRLGIAISDPTGIIAGPVGVITHVSRAADAAAIARIAAEREAVRIVIGAALGSEGELTPSARHASRLAEAVRELVSIPVELWDESGSTQAARAARLAMGVSRRKRSGHLDDLAAVIILQSYLDAYQEGCEPPSGAGSGIL